jgi:hypothetical protein
MAKRTISDCIGRARALLQDTLENAHRYSDADLLAYFNDALYELKRIRPDAWIGQYGEDLTLYASSDLTTEVPFPSTYFAPVVYYIVGMAELRDDEFAVDGRAATLLSTFERQLALPTATR